MLTDADLNQIDRDLSSCRKPTLTQLAEMVAEIRASRVELRTLNQFAVDAAKAHADLGEAIRKAGEVR